MKRKYSSKIKTTFEDLFSFENIEEVMPMTMPDIAEYIKAEDLLLRHFDFLWHRAYPNRGLDSYNDHRKTVEDGSWTNLGSLLEHAIHIVGKIKKVNTVGKDFVDISDAKLISVRTSSKGTAYSAPITNIHRKRGLLRVLCYERKQNNFYFFLIPYAAYGHISKTSNIEIPFNLDGTPRRINKCEINWWQYEVSTFEEICVPPPPPPLNISLRDLYLDFPSKIDPNLQMSILYSLTNVQQQILEFEEIQPISLSY